MEEKAAVFLFQPCQEALRILRVHVGNARLSLSQIGLIGLLDVTNKTPVEPLNAGVAGKPDALTCGDAAQQKQGRSADYAIRSVVRGAGRLGTSGPKRTIIERECRLPLES